MDHLGSAKPRAANKKLKNVFIIINLFIVINFFILLKNVYFMDNLGAAKTRAINKKN